MMKKYESVKLNHNPNWPCIPNHPYRILIRMAQDLAKLCYMNLKHQRPNVDKIYLLIKDSFESKYQLLVNRKGKVEIKHEKNPKAFIHYSQTTDDVLQNLKDYNPTKKRKVLIVFDNMIADLEANKKLSPIFT